MCTFAICSNSILMNIKLHTPKSMKAGSGISSFKQLLLSFVATTISIALTFGTAAFLDNKKKESDKREMVMMILNDFDKSIAQLEALDSSAVAAFEAQLSIIEHPETFENSKIELISLEADCKSEPSKTVESIFSSNIETINTLGNILFAEKVSGFYLNRQQLYNIMKEASQEAFNEEDGITTSFENLKKHNLSNLIFLCESFTSKLKEINEQCKQMMNVTDAEIAAFQSARLKLDTQINKAKDEESIQNMIDRNQRFQQAIESSK